MTDYAVATAFGTGVVLGAVLVLRIIRAVLALTKEERHERPDPHP